jgi:hypothetical protein
MFVFDGYDHYLTASDAGLPTGNGTCTIALAFASTSTVGVTADILFSYGTTEYRRIALNNSGKVYAIGPGGSIGTTGTYLDGAVHGVVVRVAQGAGDVAAWQLFVDGAAVGSGQGFPTATALSGSLNIGNSQYGLFLGDQVGQVAIWGSDLEYSVGLGTCAALSATLQAGGAVPNSLLSGTSPLGYWPGTPTNGVAFDPSVDASGNGRTLSYSAGTAIPCNITLPACTATITCVGAGGTGISGTSSTGGRGSGGGAFSQNQSPLSLPAGTYTFQVGLGGGVQGQPGSEGSGDTFFDSDITGATPPAYDVYASAGYATSSANFGSTDYGNASLPYNGGTHGGTGSASGGGGGGGASQNAGNSATNGANASGATGGAGGSGSGAGGHGATYVSASSGSDSGTQAGAWPGGAGGGGRKGTSGAYLAGGAGANGAITIAWTPNITFLPTWAQQVNQMAG